MTACTPRIHSEKQYRIEKARGIFVTLYEATVPYYATVNENIVRRIGSPTTGDKQIDAQMLNHDCIMLYTIDQMVELYNEGVTVRVNRYSDTEKIYNAARDYIHIFRDMILEGNSGRIFPYDDLIRLDQFTQKVYSKAKNILDSKSYTNQRNLGLFSSFQNAGFGFRNHDSIRNLFMIEDTGALELVPDADSYDSVETMFKGRLRKLNGI